MQENKKTLLLKNCSILASSTEEATYEHIQNAYLGIEGDTISYIGTEKPEGYASEKDMKGALLIPGFVNAHTHAAMVLLRGYGWGLPLDRWLNEKIFPVEDRLTEADMRAGNAFAQMEMLASGTTSYSDMYYIMDTAGELCVQSGMKLNIGRPILSFSEEEGWQENERARDSLRLFETWHGKENGRIRVDFGVHAEYTNRARCVREYAALCREKGARMHIHLSETYKEHEECKAKYNKTPAQWFAELGLFENPVTAAHGVYLEEADMELLQTQGASVMHCPTSNMKLGSGFANVKRMLELGLNVALGTDGASSNDNLNMMEELHLAALLQKGLHRDPTALSNAGALWMATRSGALAQGRPETGLLAVGKKADIAAISMDAPHMYPCFDPLAALCFSAQGSDVCMTMVDGRILYENGEFYTIDAEKARYEARQALGRIYG